MNPLRILYLEDNPDDIEILTLTLAEEDLDYELISLKTRSEYEVAIAQHNFDVIVSDQGIPQFSGQAAFEIAQKNCPSVPFIFISANVDSKEAQLYLDRGVVDYIRKDQLWRLIPVLEGIWQGRQILTPVPATQMNCCQSHYANSAYGNSCYGNSGKAPTGYAITDFSAISLEQQRERYTQAMETLVDVVQKLSLARSLEEITFIVRIAARELIGADGATFVLRDGEQCYYAEENAIEPLWKGRRFPMDICVSGWCMGHKQQVIIEDVYADDRVPIEAYRPTFVKSLVMVPIRTESPIGAIGNYWANFHQTTPQEVKLIQALADSTSIAIENVQVYNELEQRVRDRTAQLEAVNRELEAFSYTISHDLRTPLNSIKGFSWIIQKKYASSLEATGQDYLSRVCAAADRMNLQIDEMLSLHRLTRTELKRQDVNLSGIAQEIMAQLQEAAPDRHVECVIANDIVVQGDPVLLQTVLENLLSNAWKYSSKKTLASIELGILLQPDESWVLFVRDNGAGFDMDYATQLFTPFQRMHSEDEFPGTGVGLASVQRIIHKHGGRIWVDTGVDQGATFYFTIPTDWNTTQGVKGFSETTILSDLGLNGIKNDLKLGAISS